MRKRFELFASVKPVRSYPNIKSVHKEPVYRLACGMFAEECRKAAKDYPDVRLEEVLVDGFAMKRTTEMGDAVAAAV